MTKLCNIKLALVYKLEWQVALGNYYYPLDKPVSPLLISSNENLWGEGYLIELYYFSS